MRALVIALMFMVGSSTLYAGIIPNPFQCPKGDKGDKGDRGYTGNTGATGAKGDKGDRGYTGKNGHTGKTGNQGNQGYTGANGQDGTNGTNGTNGSNGTNGTNGVDGSSADSVLLNKLRATSTAMDSVELNPDHHGFSMGLGGSSVEGESAVALGLMYVFHVGEHNHNVGVNVKAYNGEGGYRGAGAGITIGF